MEPVFESQTKTKLGSTEMEVVYQQFEHLSMTLLKLTLIIYLHKIQMLQNLFNEKYYKLSVSGKNCQEFVKLRKNVLKS